VTNGYTAFKVHDALPFLLHPITSIDVLCIGHSRFRVLSCRRDLRRFVRGLLNGGTSQSSVVLSHNIVLDFLCVQSVFEEEMSSLVPAVPLGVVEGMVGTTRISVLPAAMFAARGPTAPQPWHKEEHKALRRPMITKMCVITHALPLWTRHSL
jgi:hypothetical protein